MRDLPARSTRGKRLNQLVGEEALVDEEFWKLDLFKEEVNDEEYVSEEEEEDVVDADFDAPEIADEIDPNVEGMQLEDEKKKKKGYVDPAVQRKKLERKAKKKKVNYAQDPSFETVSQPTSTPTTRTRTTTTTTINNNNANTPTTIRKSQRTSMIERATRRQEQEEILQRQKLLRANKQRKPAEFRQLTQEELLDEAKETEEYNKASLADLQRLEEEKKKQPIVEKPNIIGPAIIFHSKGGINLITFTEVEAVPSFINQPQAPPYPNKTLCPITGLPARYKDPKTGIAYATVEAFKKIREQAQEEKEREKEKTQEKEKEKEKEKEREKEKEKEKSSKRSHTEGEEKKRRSHGSSSSTKRSKNSSTTATSTPIQENTTPIPTPSLNTSNASVNANNNNNIIITNNNTNTNMNSVSPIAHQEFVLTPSTPTNTIQIPTPSQIYQVPISTPPSMYSYITPSYTTPQNFTPQTYTTQMYSASTPNIPTPSISPVNSPPPQSINSKPYQES